MKVARSSIRTRLIVLLLVPAIGLLLVAGMQLLEAFSVVRQTAEIQSLAEVAQAERNLLHTLQIERTRSLEYVAQLAGGVPGSAPPALQQARDGVESARDSLDETLARLDVADLAPQVLETDAEAQGALAALRPLRLNLDAGRAGGQNVLQAFDDPIVALLDVDRRIVALIDQAAVRDTLQGSLAISQIKDAAIRSGDVVLLSASGAISQAEATRLLTEAQADRETWLGVAQTYLSPEEIDQVVATQEGLPTPGDALALVGTSGLVDADAIAGAAGLMADVIEQRAEELRSLETAATGRAVSAATATRDDALIRAIVLSIIAGVVLATSLLLVALLLRHVVDPLRRLTRLADSVRTTLAETVERVAGGEEAGESVFDEPHGQALTGRPDELGELARAIRASTDAATRVAADQAATRASVSRTIEDVARRAQTLVERQLLLLDQLEDAEEDPDQLAQLFRLDHLATRMRRNAENLLLLASGRLPGGQDASPVPLVDVVRTAAAEIEQYARVDVRGGTPSTVVGYAATPLSHLLAELIENATQFSPPTSRVAVSARSEPQGVVVTITDRGIGMSGTEITDARRKLAAPPLLEAAESRRLGLYVVGLIAVRIGITVDLQPGPDGSGIVVDVMLPPDLCVDPDSSSLPLSTPLATATSSDAPEGPTGPRTAFTTATPPPMEPDLPADTGAGRSPLAPLAARQPAPEVTAFVDPPPLHTPPDALAEMRQLLDAQPSTPPALPDDVEPPTVEGLPTRGAGLPRREAPIASGLSLSAASRGRTVDLDHEAVGQLMASLAGIDEAGTDDDTDDSQDDGAPAPAGTNEGTAAPLPAFPDHHPSPPVAADADLPYPPVRTDWGDLDVDAFLDEPTGSATPLGSDAGPVDAAAEPAAPTRRLGLGPSRKKKPRAEQASKPPKPKKSPNTNGTASSWSTPFPPHSA